MKGLIGKIIYNSISRFRIHTITLNTKNLKFRSISNKENFSYDITIFKTKINHW